MQFERVKQLDELRSQFLANVIHELRTPSALRPGPTEPLLADPPLAPEQQRQLRSIGSSATSPLKQVNE